METEIDEVFTLARAGIISFPEYLSRIARAGVERYTVDLLRRSVVYEGLGRTYAKSMPEQYSVRPGFNEGGVKKAVASIQARGIDYPEFLKRLADAGVERYAVDVATKNVTYSGGGKSHSEPFLPPGK